MDWTRLAGSAIAALIGEFFDDDEGGGGDDTPAPEFDFGPPVIDEPQAATPPAPLQPPPPEPVPQAPAPPPIMEPPPAPVQPPPQQQPQPQVATQSATDWLGKMSPESQKILGQGTAGGVFGLMQALAAKNAQEDSRERENRAREDKIRRGSIPAIGGAYSPKGIIGSRMG